MASEQIKVEVIHKETITPSSQTPQHLKTLFLSVFDQLNPELYVQLLLFYPGNRSEVVDDDRRSSEFSKRSKLLKTSLSEALTHFYPLAGRFQYNVSICCNDQGAAFIEARVKCPISKILDKPDVGMLEQLLPTDDAAGTGYLLLVQATFFECGGVAIGVKTSHKVADAHTLSTFINSWAAISLASLTTSTVDVAVLPHPDQFSAAASLFPPVQYLNSPTPSTTKAEEHEKCVLRRFVFDASKIAFLKSKAASPTVPNPSSAEVVSSLIWKCLMEATSKSNLGSVRPSVWFQAMNLRKRLLGLPLAENVLGNLVGFFSASVSAEEADAHEDISVINLKHLVAKMRKGMEETKAHFSAKLLFDSNEACLMMRQYKDLMENNGIDSYGCTSWCRFPFYEADFGWGKPSWLCAFASPAIKNVLVLIDKRDCTGIEAWLALTEENMALFENNVELLAYASLNPSAT